MQTDKFIPNSQPLPPSETIPKPSKIFISGISITRKPTVTLISLLTTPTQAILPAPIVFGIQNIPDLTTGQATDDVNLEIQNEPALTIAQATDDVNFEIQNEPALTIAQAAVLNCPSKVAQSTSAQMTLLKFWIFLK